MLVEGTSVALKKNSKQVKLKTPVKVEAISVAMHADTFQHLFNICYKVAGRQGKARLFTNPVQNFRESLKNRKLYCYARSL